MWFWIYGVLGRFFFELRPYSWACTINTNFHGSCWARVKKSRNSPKWVPESSWNHSSSKHGAQSCHSNSKAALSTHLKKNTSKLKERKIKTGGEGQRRLLKMCVLIYVFTYLFLGAQGSMSSPMSRRSGLSQELSYWAEMAIPLRKQKTHTKLHFPGPASKGDFWLIRIREFIQTAQLFSAALA